MSIRSLGYGFEPGALLEQIAAHPEIWNTHKMRTEAYQTPHNAVSDIWVRYNEWANFNGDPQAFNAEHKSVWYPVIDKIPACRALVRQVFKHVKGGELGGVLITKIPPGGEVKPHIDTGWHAGYYDKYALQLQGNERQAFCFEDSSLSALPGELYTFDNSKLHWVTNDSDEDRMTLITCIRKCN